MSGMRFQNGAKTVITQKSLEFQPYFAVCLVLYRGHGTGPRVALSTSDTCYDGGGTFRPKCFLKDGAP